MTEIDMFGDEELYHGSKTGIRAVYKHGSEWREEVGYKVSFPHQCDGWHIGGTEYSDPLDKNQMIQAMEDFIEESQAALDAVGKHVAES